MHACTCMRVHACVHMCSNTCRPEIPQGNVTAQVTQLTDLQSRNKGIEYGCLYGSYTKRYWMQGKEVCWLWTPTRTNVSKPPSYHKKVLAFLQKVTEKDINQRKKHSSTLCEIFGAFLKGKKWNLLLKLGNARKSTCEIRIQHVGVMWHQRHTHPLSDIIKLLVTLWLTMKRANPAYTW